MNYIFYQIQDTILLDKVFPPNDSARIFSDTLNLIVENTLNTNKTFGLSPENAKILIPVLVTFCIFLLGIIINITIRKYERKSYLASIKSVIATWSKLLENPINQQSKSCRDFNSRLTKSSEMQPESFKFNNLLAGQILSIQLKDPIDTIVLNHKGKNEDKSKCLFNIISQYEFIDKFEKELRIKYEIYHQDSLKYMEEWNDAYKKLDTVRTSLRIQYQTNTSHPIYPFYSEVAKIFNLFVKNNPKGGDINVHKDQLFSPILELCQKFVISNPDQQDIYLVSFAIQEFFIVIRKWDVNRTGTGQLFENFADRIDSSIKTLKSNIDKLEKMKFKFLLAIK